MNDEVSGSWPTVSVLLPVRNEASFIERSLGAVFAQDYPPELIEIVVADGMSTDATRDIVAMLQEDHPNLHLIDNPCMTVPYAMNLATAASSGEIIVRVDGHCEIAPDYVRNCVKHLVEDGVDGVGGPWEQIGETPAAVSISLATASRFGVGGSAYRVYRGENRLVDTVPFPAYTRKLVEQIGPYDEEQTRDQDDEYNYRIREQGGTLLLASDVRSRYYSRASLRKMASQYYQYGFWKVRVTQKHPRQMQTRHFVPLAFVASLVAAAGLAPFSRAARRALFMIILTYGAANLGVSWSIAREHGMEHMRVLPQAFFLLHGSYGLGFLVGLIKFADKWQASGE